MSHEPELRELVAPMAEREVSLGDAAFRVDRQRVLARMALAGRPERRAWRGVAALAVAAALALVVGARLWPRGAALELVVSAGRATQVHGATRVELAPRLPARIAADGELETGADSQASVRTSEGLEIELRGRTRLTLGELQTSARRVTLLGGAIRCSVPHGTAPRVFQVVTSDVTVVDLGTVFTVSVDGPDHATRVSVEEGEVLVRQGAVETRVRAPSAWSSAPAPTSTPLPTRGPAVSPLPGPRAVMKAPRRAAPEGTLAQEAQLLRLGLAAERQGRPEQAIAALDELVTRYPRSPLAGDARAALARVEAAARP